MTQDTASIHATQRLRRRIIGFALVITATLATACAEVGSGPDVPAAIEFARLPYPSVVIGDTLRNEAGAPTALRAIVRNSAGDEITGAPVRYLYADYNRDSSLIVDSTRGTVFALKVAVGSPSRVAARAGSSLQILGNLIVTVAPDTVSGTAPGLLELSLPDTARKNTTGEFTVSVRNRATTTPTGVNGWVVRYELLRPANPTNDTTAGAYLVADSQGGSVIDTTDVSGNATRRVRVRPNLFPAAAGTDSVIVQVTVRYRGNPVKGSPLRLATPVKR